MDQVFHPHLLQPAGLRGGNVLSDLRHVGFVGMFGDAQDMHVACAEMNGEQNIVGGLAQQADDIHREEIRSGQHIQMVADETLPRRVGSSLWCRLNTVAVEYGTDGTRRNLDLQFQFSLNALLAPGGILGSHPDDQCFYLTVSTRAPGFSVFDDTQLTFSHQSEPPPDGRRLGHGRDLGHALSANPGSSACQAFAPLIGEVELGPGRELVAKETVLGPEKAFSAINV